MDGKKYSAIPPWRSERDTEETFSPEKPPLERSSEKQEQKETGDSETTPKLERLLLFEVTKID